jgi:hypothetical protein
MSTIFHVMREEYERLVSLEHKYREGIAALPKGSARVKHIRNGDYLYLTHRVKNRVVDDYVGPADSAKAKETLREVEKRKRVQSLLRETRQALKDVRKALRGKL